jgi:hypothetical protein
VFGSLDNFIQKLGVPTDFKPIQTLILAVKNRSEPFGVLFEVWKKSMLLGVSFLCLLGVDAMVLSLRCVDDVVSLKCAFRDGKR